MNHERYSYNMMVITSKPPALILFIQLPHPPLAILRSKSFIKFKIDDYVMKNKKKLMTSLPTYLPHGRADMVSLMKCQNSQYKLVFVGEGFDIIRNMVVNHTSCYPT